VAQAFDFDKTKDLIIGDDLTLQFEIFEDDLCLVDGTLPNCRPGLVYESGTPVDVSGWTFAFAVRTSNTITGTPILQYTSGSGITITGVFDLVHAANTQRVNVTIPDTDTFSDLEVVLVPPATYFYSLKRTNAGLEKTLAYGKLILLEKPRRL